MPGMADVNEQVDTMTEAGRASGGAYDETNITVLEGLEAVRHRPAMYIGGTGISGLHHLVYEVVDNSVDEALAGCCNRIVVRLLNDGSCSVTDNGRGIPVGPKQSDNPMLDGKPALEIVMTVLHAGGKFDKGSYKVSGGLHGVGVSVVNALSEWLKVEVGRDGRRYQMSFARGDIDAPLTSVPDAAFRGTHVWFKPDPQIFPDCEFRYETLQTRLRELAFLNNGLRIRLIDERADREQESEFFFRDGLREFCRHLVGGSELLHNDVIYLKAVDETSGLGCEVALQWTDAYNENLLCYANNIHNVHGGVHLSGLKSSITRVANTYARNNNLIKGNTTVVGDDWREGLTGVISVKVPEPQFEGQTKVKLLNPEVESYVQQTVNELLGAWFEEHPSDARKIVVKGVQAAQAREAARKARDLARKSVLSGGGLPGKLWDCRSRKADETEIYFVEGDSAGGIAKQGRDSYVQAILPLKGKILNVEKARIDKMLSHDEITKIISAMGCGIGKEDFDVSKRRYGKLIIMTDADVDGSHIRTLLLTFLFRHMRPLIEEGRVYVAQPPLYQVRKGKHVEYVLDDRALNAKLTELALQGLTLIVRDGDGRERTIERQQLGELVGLLDGLEAHTRVLARRGLSFEHLVLEHRDAQRGLPGILALVHRPDQDMPERRLLFSEEDLESLHAQESAGGGEVLLTDARRLLLELAGDNGDSGGPKELSPHRIVYQMLVTTPEIERLLRRIEALGFAAGDLFLTREELVTGELPPAKFILRPEGGDPVELDNLAQVAEGVRDLGRKGLAIKRFKGLGEMNADELWETTMDPQVRTLRRVNISDDMEDLEQADIDAAEADRVFSLLMGDNVEKRRRFIEENAATVKNLDV